MAESKELNRIKKLYGEKFMHLCRRLFPTLLEQEGLLTKILEENFSTNSRTLGEDITERMEEDFKNFIFSKVNVEKEQIEVIEKKTPYELLEEAGYELYECTSEKEIQSFRKYYKPGEELCTFNGGRLNRCVVFWAVKKDADKIIREDFERPKREDKYGTSVMSIQFSRGKTSTVSIKNRYNHTVNNPDATYGNDLDRIVPGLKQSFAELLAERGMKLDASNTEEFDIPNYVVANDGKYYKYNTEINGIYYCPGNVIIDHGEVIQLESEKEVLMDYFILDKEKKTLKLYDSRIPDSFLDGFENIEKIEMIKNPDKEKQTRLIKIKTKDSDKPVVIEIDKDNNIVGYENQELKQVGKGFLGYNNNLRELNLPLVEKVGNYFLLSNHKLSNLNMPQLKEVGDYFLKSNILLSQLNLPQLTKVGNGFICNNKKLSQLNLPLLTEVGHLFISGGGFIRQISLPRLRKTGGYFLGGNEYIDEIYLPQLEEVGDDFLYANKRISQINLPLVRKIGNCFLCSNDEIDQVDLPQLKEVGDNFLFSNQVIKQLKLPELTKTGRNFLGYNPNMKELYIPKLEQIDEGFLWGHPQKEQLIANIHKRINIKAEDISELDKEKQLTTTEVSLARRIIEKIKSMFYKKDDSQR